MLCYTLETDLFRKEKRQKIIIKKTNAKTTTEQLANKNDKTISNEKGVRTR